MTEHKTCPGCGKSKPRNAYYNVRRADGRERSTAYCKLCHTARVRRDQLADATYNDQSLERETAKQDESIANSTNAGRAWTADDYATVMREDITLREAAALLGRTYWATCRARQRALKNQARRTPLEGRTA